MITLVETVAENHHAICPARGTDVPSLAHLRTFQHRGAGVFGDRTMDMALRVHRIEGIPIEKRFWHYVKKLDGCWIWCGTIDQNGYGKLTWRTKGVQSVCSAHRVSWLVNKGEIPDRMFVCHHCDNKRCVRPSHLFLGTAKDNTHDAIVKGRMAFQRITHCFKGHEYVAENTYWHNNRGKLRRKCKACKREWDRLGYLKRKGEILCQTP